MKANEKIYNLLSGLYIKFEIEKDTVKKADIMMSILDIELKLIRS